MCRADIRESLGSRPASSDGEWACRASAVGHFGAAAAGLSQCCCHIMWFIIICCIGMYWSIMYWRWRNCSGLRLE